MEFVLDKIKKLFIWLRSFSFFENLKIKKSWTLALELPEQILQNGLKKSMSSTKHQYINNLNRISFLVTRKKSYGPDNNVWQIANGRGMDWFFA
jgi:hypothetical protein